MRGDAPRSWVQCHQAQLVLLAQLIDAELHPLIIRGRGRAPVVCAPLEHAFCSAVKRSEARVSSCCKRLRISSRADGKELYYTDADNKIMAVDIIEHGASLQVGTPHALWQPRLQPVVNPPYAATGDGKRFLANELPLQSPSHLL